MHTLTLRWLQKSLSMLLILTLSLSQVVPLEAL